MAMRYVKNKRKIKEDGSIKEKKIRISTNKNAERYLESQYIGLSYEEATEMDDVPYEDRKQTGNGTEDDIMTKPAAEEKPYYIPASKDQMRLHSFEYVWFSTSR